MLVRVQVRLLCGSETDAITVRDAIRQRVANRQRVTHSAVEVAFKDQWIVFGDVSFTIRADAEDVYTDVQAKWGGGQLRNRIVSGSTATLHVCAHAEDEPPPWQDCREIDYQLATKG